MSDDASVVPAGVRAAAEWTWRLLLIGLGIYVVGRVLGHFTEVVVPVVVAILLAALLGTPTRAIARVIPRGAAAGIIVIGTLAAIVGSLTIVGTQFSNGFDDIVDQVAQGITQIRTWINETFGITDSQFTTWFDNLRHAVQQNGNLASTATQAGVTATHFVAGLFITLFSLFFFLYDGERIWAWVVRLFPRRARDRVDSSGEIAWRQLTSFTHATVLVAAVDAIGIALGAAILRVPFVVAIALLVFIGAFVPVVGATISGIVAVLLALVAHGPLVALIMLGVIIAVQQIEAHVLQPFLLGRAVRVHPLAVILALAIGVIVAGIFGALIAVPFAACVNGVVHHLFEEPAEPTPDPSEEDTGSLDPEPVPARDEVGEGGRRAERRTDG